VTAPAGRWPLAGDRLELLAGTRFADVHQLAETTSTNSVLLEKALEDAPEGLVVVADHQSAGRGRFDRRWEAPAGSSLLFSVLLRPSYATLPANRRHLVVAAVSLAVVDAARALASADLRLKWPNDIVSGDRKLAGILAEATPDGAVVVGAGVNVAWAPPGEAATCLDMVSPGRHVDRSELLVESLLALDRLYGKWDLVSRRYREANATVGREVTVALGDDVAPLSGQAVAIDDDGRLVVRDRSGRLVEVAAGDITHASA
jgi:BirA family transcriptional regulator, biotin operon repressor / biotin---[acetyl-CoA-carboxylase] ligase